MAPVGIYPTGAVSLYGGRGVEARRACGEQDVSYWRCELLHFMRYGAKSRLANAQ